MSRSIQSDWSGRRASRSGVLAGARSNQGNVTLDGLDNNDPVQSYAFNGVLVPPSIPSKNFESPTTAANAEPGRSSGAQVNIL
jgi:hypothetical protein